MKKGKATKKPVEINWFKWEEDLQDLTSWLKSFNKNLEEVINWTLSRCPNCPPTIKIKTLEGSSYKVPNGYIIIRGVEGEFYPCEPNIFEKTYNIN